MNRAKMRRIVKIAVDGEFWKPENWPVLEDALAVCHNPKVRAEMKSRIMREGHAHNRKG